MFKLPVLFLAVLTALVSNAQKTPQVPPANTQPKPKTVIRKVPFAELVNINEVYYFNNKPFTGISIESFEDKTKMQEIQWKDGLIDGTKTEYFKGGVLVRAKLYFKEGKRIGPFQYFHANGQLKLSGKYVNDLLDSTVNAFYDNGNPKYIFTYVMGEKTGLSISYFSNGSIEQKVHLINEKPNGRMETYYEAGNLRLVTDYDQGIRNGQFIRYHLTGIKAEESYFKNGIQDSVSYYWDNVYGNLLKQEYYKVGLKEGTWLTFDEFGDTLTMFNYMDNVLHGPYKKFVSENVYTGEPGNGKDAKFDKTKSSMAFVHQLDEYGSYNMGKQDGVFKAGLYNRENHVEGQFKDGVMIGEWRYYNDEDKLVLYELYNDMGELIKQKPKLQRTKGD